MLKSNIIQKIIDNKSEIVGIRLDGIFYDVDYISVDDVDVFDMLAHDDTIMYCYQLDENNCYLEYIFEVADILKARDVKLYKLQEL